MLTARIDSAAFLTSPPAREGATSTKSTFGSTPCRPRDDSPSGIEDIRRVDAGGRDVNRCG